MTEPKQSDFRQHLELETPEHVVLDYDVAGVGSRALAAMVDWAIVFVLLFVAILATATAAALVLGLWGVVLLIVTTYGVIWGYFTLFEGLRGGQTPGKKMMGIRVIRDTGHGIGFGEAAARNLLMPIDMAGMIGLIMIAVHPRGKRLGDIVAGTVVVRDRPVQATTAEPLAREPAVRAVGAPELSDDDFVLLRSFASRASALPPEVRSRFASQLAVRFEASHPDRPIDDMQFVLELHRDELARRSGRFGARAGASGRSVAERLVALKTTRWNEFQLLADRVTAGGLDVLSAGELPDFATRYREIAADLARARTYRADSQVRVRLERLVAAGHSALYRSTHHTWQRIWWFVARDCPGAVLRSWRYVAVAYLVFLGTAGAGYALLRAHPALAPELLPDTMLERAEAGAERVAAGKGYVLVTTSFRPLVATKIILNNVGVAFRCFAGGIVFGFGSLVLLAFNGLLLGAVSGHFANVGMLGYLWTFVAGHGVLEITAICIASAAGFLLGRSIIAPGDLPRGDAVALAGRTALRLVGTSVILLLIAGTIEGMISTSGWSVPARLTVTGASTLFLAAYLYNGRRSTFSR